MRIANRSDLANILPATIATVAPVASTIAAWTAILQASCCGMPARPHNNSWKPQHGADDDLPDVRQGAQSDGMPGLRRSEGNRHSAAAIAETAVVCPRSVRGRNRRHSGRLHCIRAAILPPSRRFSRTGGNWTLRICRDVGCDRDSGNATAMQLSCFRRFQIRTLLALQL